MSSSSSSRLSPLAHPFAFNFSNTYCFSNIGAISSFPQYPSRAVQLPFNVSLSESGSDFDAITPVSGIIRPGYILCKSGSGKSPAEGFKLCGEKSDCLYGKCIGISGMDNENKSKDAKQIDVACVSYQLTSELCAQSTSELFHTTIHTESGLTGPLTLSSCDSNTTFYERNFAEQLDSYAANLKFSHSSESNYSPVSGPAGTHTEKSMDRENGKPIIPEVMNSLIMSNSELQITNLIVPHDLTVKLHGAKEADPVEDSSNMLGINDSDLDSPCWKGTMAAYQSTFEDSGPVDSQYLKSRQEALSSLNPLAFQLFPSNNKQNMSSSGNGYGGDNFSFFLETASSAVNLLSKELRSANSDTAGSSSSELSNINETHCSNDIHLPDKEGSLLKYLISNPMLKLSCMLPPLQVNNYCKYNCQLITGPNVSGCVIRTEHAKYHCSTGIPVGSQNVFSSSFCRVGVPSDLTKAHGDATRYFSRSPRLDLKKMVVTMNCQKCSCKTVQML
ncbi:hypothetical protein GH714_011687 [Hevea brasiliensis]|uniref:Uncharacterized protein n=1 Tax=Hevea brasiliensis TaxID=3981 RepID=A0A6A6MMK5_HEVBR|nr:hypothetical protein GH714_011687 [Hevea brasiliensis]